MLVLEDVHWADSSSLDLLNYLARTAGQERLLIVLTCRDDALATTPTLAAAIRELGRAEMSRDIAPEAVHRGPGPGAARHLGRPAPRRALRPGREAVRRQPVHGPRAGGPRRDRGRPHRGAASRTPGAGRRAAGRRAVRPARGRGARGVHPARGPGEGHREHGRATSGDDPAPPHAAWAARRGGRTLRLPARDPARERHPRDVAQRADRGAPGRRARAPAPRAGTGRLPASPAGAPPRGGGRVRRRRFRSVWPRPTTPAAVYAFAEARRQLAVARELLWNRVDDPEGLSGLSAVDLVRREAEMARWAGQPSGAVALVRTGLATVPSRGWTARGWSSSWPRRCGPPGIPQQPWRPVNAARPPSRRCPASRRCVRGSLAADRGRAGDDRAVRPGPGGRRARDRAGRESGATRSRAPGAHHAGHRDRTSGRSRGGRGRAATVPLRGCRRRRFKAVVRCYGNLAFLHSTAGRLGDVLEIATEGDRTCRRFGPLLLVAPTLAENWVHALVATGRWDEAARGGARPPAAVGRRGDGVGSPPSARPGRSGAGIRRGLRAADVDHRRLRPPGRPVHRARRHRGPRRVPALARRCRRGPPHHPRVAGPSSPTSRTEEWSSACAAWHCGRTPTW